MWLSFIYVCIFFFTFSKGQFGSYEVKQIDLTPLHDAIIFNDIADIMNEFENNMSPQLNKYIFSGSDSSEDIDDLLSEYQHYLDKAHKQRINYVKNSKGKNKVPLIHHEKYTKMKQGTQNKYDTANDYYNSMKYTQPSFMEPFNLFMSHNANNKPEFIDRPPGNNILLQTNKEKALLNLIPAMSNINKPMASCYCKSNEIPCKCNCKQCFILTDSMPTSNINKYDNQNIFRERFSKTSKNTLQNKINNFNEDELKIRIKIGVQLPKILSEVLHKYRNQDDIEGEGILSKEIVSTINLPFPHFNFPIPIDFLGYKKNYNKNDHSALHKITIHKKKKSRSSNSKKHTGKKLITFHSIKQDKPIEHNSTEENNRIRQNSTAVSHNKRNGEPKLQTNEPQNSEMITNNVSNNTVTDLPLKNMNGSIETIYLTVNITKKNDNDTSEPVKIENSIETDFVEKNNKTIVESLRLKREALEQNITTATKIQTNISATTMMPLKLSQTIENHKKFNKTIAGEMELLYWPIQTKNITLVKSKNITALILERETKKAKLNMTYDKIRSNRTTVLEHAIFGDVDWNDVDTVAPVFMSFVGKYIRGILTFCSQNICHSMKCSEKKCHHRICTPENRFNHKGHCTGNNDTDSVAAMESIMDLPSNIGFEIVDILQNKMLGKMYGKATLCIMSKCSTFVASKKNFQRSKCTSKALSSLGHCPMINDELYSSPWSSIKKAAPKIIDFDATGHPTLKNMPLDKVVTFKEIAEYVRNERKKVRLNYDDIKLWNSTYVASEIKNFITNHLQPRKKIKALTNCIKDLQLCRFLFCPNIKQNCILCEVQTKNNYENSTTCKTFNTSFLIDHGLFN